MNNKVTDFPPKLEMRIYTIVAICFVTIIIIDYCTN